MGQPAADARGGPKDFCQRDSRQKFATKTGAEDLSGRHFDAQVNKGIEDLNV